MQVLAAPAASAEAYYDDFRVTQGLARYSGASFTPPSTAHLTSAGDANKQIIVNSSADGVDVGTGGINQARIAKAESVGQVRWKCSSGQHDPIKL
jgi:hypothetical protein